MGALRSARRGLGRALERRLARAFGGGAGARMKAAAAVKAAGALVTRHPRAALDMAGAGLAGAGHAGLTELGVLPGEREAPPQADPPPTGHARRLKLSPKDRRRLLRFLKEAGDRPLESPLPAHGPD